MRICLVTEELASVGEAGGIGAAFHELALALAKGGHTVDMLYCPIVPIDESAATARLGYHGIKLILLQEERYAWGNSHDKKSYSIYRTLRERDEAYDVVHFHDYKGLGFFALQAKRQGLAFADTTFVTQLHGPTRWALEANGSLFTHREQLLIDFMERACIRDADHVVSPSRYLVDWLGSAGFDLPPPERVHVIKNLCSLSAVPTLGTPAGRVFPNEIVYFARHEDRKGIVQFCDALDPIARELRERRVVVTFLGRLGEIRGVPSGIWLTKRVRQWPFQLRIRTEWKRQQAIDYLRESQEALVVIPSPAENSPYTVVEALRVGRPVITSDRGGARELIDAAYHAECLSDLSADDLSRRILGAIDKGIRVPAAAESEAEIEQAWLQLHAAVRSPARPGIEVRETAPSIVFGITHHERPDKVVDAIVSAVRQTYRNLQIVVIDDGSTSQAATAALAKIERMMERVGGRLIRQQNAYLGAARNAIARATNSDYLVFLDDDDVAFPDMVETLASVAERTGADVVNCLNLFMEEERRPLALAALENFEQKVSYTPTGGPLSLALTDNVFGGATALIRRSFFDEIGGYSELHGVGFEDYEFYLRALQAGGRIEVVPEPLYLYEVGKPNGMIVTTPFMRNFKRIIDACDFARDTAAWRDMSTVAAGTVARQHIENRMRWEFQQSPHAALLEDIVASTGDPARHYEALARYAQAIGAPWLAQDWLDAASGERSDEGLRAVPTGTLSRGLAAGMFVKPQKQALFKEALFDAALGRADDAARAVATGLASVPEIDADILSAVKQVVLLCRDREPGLKSLYAALIETPAAPDMQAAVAATATLVAFKAGLASEMRAMIRKIEAYESSEYISRYPDLDVLQPEAALDHFRRHGLDEGRKGFCRLAEIAAELRQATGRSFRAWDVVGYVERQDG